MAHVPRHAMVEGVQTLEPRLLLKPMVGRAMEIQSSLKTAILKHVRVSVENKTLANYQYH